MHSDEAQALLRASVLALVHLRLLVVDRKSVHSPLGQRVVQAQLLSTCGRGPCSRTDDKTKRRVGIRRVVAHFTASLHARIRCHAKKPRHPRPRIVSTLGQMRSRARAMSRRISARQTRSGECRECRCWHSQQHSLLSPPFVPIYQHLSIPIPTVPLTRGCPHFACA